MKKKSEKFNICTFCLSKMCKLLGVWAVAWLLPVQVSRFTFRSRGFPNPFYAWLTFSKISQVSPGDPI